MGSARRRPARPWRSNLEAATMAIVVAVLFKYFVVEAYRIPTGSMQPTLFGWTSPEGDGVHDRILVDKFSYHYRDPVRHEVVVFRYPLDLSKHFIKRIWGLPGERLRIRHGDVWRETAEGEWEVVRRSDAVMDEMWLPVGRAGDWRVERGSVDVEHDVVRLERRGSMTYPPRASSGESVVDLYLDGYPEGIADRMAQRGGRHEVGDLRVELTAEPADGKLWLELREGDAVYEAWVDAEPLDVGWHGAIVAEIPEAPEGDAGAAFTTDGGSGPTPRARVAFQNLDDELRLELDGEVVARVEVAPQRDQRSSVELSFPDGPGVVRDLRLLRDVHYTGGRLGRSEWRVPADSYFVLGDNTQDSADSREWQLAGFAAAPEDGSGGPEVWGARRAGENPSESFAEDVGPVWYFRDRFGERHRLPTRRTSRLTPRTAPYVPRENVTGRAVAVFWPWSRRYDVWRGKWVR